MSQPTADDRIERDLEQFLHGKIPLTRAMGVQVMECRERVVLTAPLGPNVNHLGTAFGGSLHALPTLACYCMLWTILRGAGLDGHVVVKRSSARYRQPVTGELRAVCAPPGPATAGEFLADVRRHRKARLDLVAVVNGAGDRPAVEFEGSFVALV